TSSTACCAAIPPTSGLCTRWRGSRRSPPKRPTGNTGRACCGTCWRALPPTSSPGSSSWTCCWRVDPPGPRRGSSKRCRASCPACHRRPGASSSVPGLPESVASSLERAVALAVGDYDDDETEDLFVAGHLFRGSLGRFVETSAGAGLAFQDRTNRPVAAAFGDFDNDGRLDLYVATTGRGVLLRNEGGGRFRDVVAAGLADSGSVATVLFSDLDHDGDLDLFVATRTGNRAYRNNLDGTFREMAAPMGLAMVGSRDAAAADFDGDGRTDLVVVATDGSARLFHNRGQGRFED